MSKRDEILDAAVSAAFECSGFTEESAPPSELAEVRELVEAHLAHLLPDDQDVPPWMIDSKLKGTLEPTTEPHEFPLYFVVSPSADPEPAPTSTCARCTNEVPASNLREVMWVGRNVPSLLCWQCRDDCGLLAADPEEGTDG